MKLTTKIKKLFPKTSLGRFTWISGALIEIIGFALLFNASNTIDFLSNNSFLISFGLIGIGLIVAMSGRKIKK